MAKKVYIAELDAHTATLIKKIEDISQQTVLAGQKMNAAFNKVTGAIEKDMTRTAGTLTKFSRRDLGILSAQLLTTADVTGKLGGQLSNLATGLLTGGAIGGAFAGFAALINYLNTLHSDQIKLIDDLTGSLDKARENVTTLISEWDKLMEPSFLEQLEFILTGKINNSEFKARMDMLEKIGKSFKQMEEQEGSVKYRLENQIKINTELRDQATSAQEFTKYQKIINELQTTYNDLLGKTNKKEKERVDYQKYLSKQSQALIPREVNKEAWLAGIGTKTDFSKDKFKTSPIEDWYMTIWKPDIQEFAKPLEEAQQPMSALVSLSNQMASNFSFAGHTFVGQLSQAIAMVDSISNMILTIASIFTNVGGFGLGGLLGLIGLEKGGRVSNKFGNVTLTPIPSFARGGSYSTPAFSGPFGGGYPVMVHKNETLDVYNSGQTSRLENKLDGIKNAVMAGTIASTRKRGGGGGVIKINIGRREIATIVQEELNNFTKSGYNLGEF